MTDDVDAIHVKIWVRTEPEDGYPPEEWEGLWAIPMGDGRFKVDNIPFFARDLSCDDIVEAAQDGNKYIFTKVINPSENSTIRVVIYDLADENEVRDYLSSAGCSIEGTGIPGLIAVNVPKSSLDRTVDLLEKALAEEKLGFEEGALR